MAGLTLPYHIKPLMGLGVAAAQLSDYRVLFQGDTAGGDAALDALVNFMGQAPGIGAVLAAALSPAKEYAGWREGDSSGDIVVGGHRNPADVVEGLGAFTAASLTMAQWRPAAAVQRLAPVLLRHGCVGPGARQKALLCSDCRPYTLLGTAYANISNTVPSLQAGAAIEAQAVVDSGLGKCHTSGPGRKELEKLAHELENRVTARLQRSIGE